MMRLSEAIEKALAKLKDETGNLACGDNVSADTSADKARTDAARAALREAIMAEIK